MIFGIGLWTFMRALVTGSAAVVLVLQRSVPRPGSLVGIDSSGSGCHALWTGWRASLVIVQPATVLAWHRQGFQL